MSKHGINVKGHRILVLPNEVETKTASGIITSTPLTEKQEKLANIDGIVIAMGNTCFLEYDEPWCVVGDKIIFGKYSGIFLKGDDGKEYRIINDENVVATREKNNE